MRYRELFTVFPRRLKSGRTVYCYQTYDGGVLAGLVGGEDMRVREKQDDTA